MNYNELFTGEDFAVIEISEIKESTNNTFYREFVFDKHPNPKLRTSNAYIPKVREFHRNEHDFLDIKVGQILHDVHIYATCMNHKLAGRLYALERFDDVIVFERR